VPIDRAPPAVRRHMSAHSAPRRPRFVQLLQRVLCTLCDSCYVRDVADFASWLDTAAMVPRLRAPRRPVGLRGRPPPLKGGRRQSASDYMDQMQYCSSLY
jgi:hypothetical protein